MHSLQAAASSVVLGSFAAREKTRLVVRIGAAVLGLDFATKVLAVLLLEEGAPVHLFGGAVSFELAFNPTALGPLGRLAGSGGAATFIGAQLCLGLASLVTAGRANADMRLSSKVLMLLFLGLVAAFAAEPLGQVATQVLGQWLPQLKIFCIAAFSVLLFRLARSRALFTLLVVLSSAYLSYALSLYLVPRGVVEFVRIPALAPLGGFANLADFVMTAALTAVACLVPVRIGRELLRIGRGGIAALPFNWIDRPLSR